MGDTAAEVWLNIHRWNALSEVLEEEGSGIEKHLQDYLIELYTEKVPLERQRQIDQRLAEEDMEAKRYREENRQFSAYRLRSGGKEIFFESDQCQNAARAASTLRGCIREKIPVTASVFGGPRSELRTIDAELFERRAADYRTSSVRIHGVLDIDMDAGSFSFVVRGKGWRHYSVKDAAAAAYSAFRAPNRKDDRALVLFIEKLQGKELTPPTRRLTVEDIRFSDEISEMMDGKLNFYMDVIFNPDEVFGTHVETAENGDWLNVYANYDMEQRQVCDTLDIILHRDAGKDEELSYRLDPVEKELVARKMDAYCLEREGVSLADFRAQLLNEQDESPEQGMAPLQ